MNLLRKIKNWYSRKKYGYSLHILTHNGNQELVFNISYDKNYWQEWNAYTFYVLFQMVAVDQTFYYDLKKDYSFLVTKGKLGVINITP